MTASNLIVVDLATDDIILLFLLCNKMLAAYEECVSLQ